MGVEESRRSGRASEAMSTERSVVLVEQCMNTIAGVLTKRDILNETKLKQFLFTCWLVLFLPTSWLSEREHDTQHFPIFSNYSFSQRSNSPG